MRPQDVGCVFSAELCANACRRVIRNTASTTRSQDGEFLSVPQFYLLVHSELIRPTTGSFVPGSFIVRGPQRVRWRHVFRTRLSADSRAFLRINGVLDELVFLYRMNMADNRNSKQKVHTVGCESIVVVFEPSGLSPFHSSEESGFLKNLHFRLSCRLIVCLMGNTH